MNCRLQDEVQSMCEGAEAWCAGNRKFWAAAVGHKRTLPDIFKRGFDVSRKSWAIHSAKSAHSNWSGYVPSVRIIAHFLGQWNGGVC